MENNNPGNSPQQGSEQNQGTSNYNTGSTTQGGPNTGQGSSQLGVANQQGSELNSGANYDNENRPQQPAKEQPTQYGQGESGGQAGYSSQPERQETNKEQQQMHNERDPKQLNADENTQIDEDLDRSNK